MPEIVAAAIGLAPKEAIDFLRQKLAVPSEHWTDVWKQAHARSFMVAGAASQALVEDFHREVLRALDHGTTLAEFRKTFDTIVEKHGWVQKHDPGWRAKIIYETNLSMAYAAGRYAQMTAPATLAVFPYWQYVHSGSRHPRVQHLAWNGLTLRADDPWWDSHYPPNGWHCGCRVRPLMRRELTRLGKDGPDTAPEIQLRPWTNKHTGEVHQVPIGIDPGFDYNVGKAWKGKLPRTPAEARVTTPADRPKALPLDPVKTPPAAPIGRLVPPPAPQTDADVGAADAAMKRAFRPLRTVLSEEQKTVLARYQGPFHRPLNMALRREFEREAPLDALIATLDQAFTHVAAAPARVYRGVRGRYAADLRQVSVGTILTDQAYSSTSLSQAVAATCQGERGLMLEILIAAGHKGAIYLPAVPALDGAQFELLLARGARFRVVSNDGARIVLELL